MAERRTCCETIRDRASAKYGVSPIVGHESPPFRALSAQEMEEAAARIDASGAHIIMVSLGCPKQERWMAAMKGKVNGVMLGLGGAFLLYAGVDSRAPKWMRDLSLEWLYRLALEPGRLWKRYFVTNTIFLGMVIGRLFRGRTGTSEGDPSTISASLLPPFAFDESNRIIDEP